VVASDASISGTHRGDQNEQFNHIRADSSDGGNPGEAGSMVSPKARSLICRSRLQSPNHTDLCREWAKHGGHAARLLFVTVKRPSSDRRERRSLWRPLGEPLCV